MCIRDRDDTLSGCKDLAVEKLQQLLDKVKISEFKSQGIETVSYTHLDVYKRQVYDET